MRYGKGVSIIQEVLITSTYIFDLVLDDLILDNLVLDDGTPTGFKADANTYCSAKSIVLTVSIMNLCGRII